MLLQARKQRLYNDRKAALVDWGKAKYKEMNAPLEAQDEWVHKRVLAGQARAFTNARMGAKH